MSTESVTVIIKQIKDFPSSQKIEKDLETKKAFVDQLVKDKVFEKQRYSAVNSAPVSAGFHPMFRSTM